MLAKKDLLIQNYMYVGELCWWKFFCMLVKSIFAGEICMLVKTFTNMQLSLTYLRKFYVGENHQNQIFDLLLRSFKIGWWSIRSWKFKYKYVMIVQSVRSCLSIRSWLKVCCPSYAVLAESIRSFARNFDFSYKVRRKVYDLWVINNTIVRE